MSIDWSGKGIADADIEAIANRVRMASGPGNADKPDLLGIIEHLGEHETWLQGLSWEVVKNSRLPNARAEAHVARRKILITENTRSGNQSGDWNSTYAIAHEIGHIALNHEGEAKQKSYKKVRYLEGVPKYRSVERQADVFATCFLMPNQKVQTSANAQEVAERFGCPLHVATARFNEVQKRHVGRDLPPDVIAGIALQREIADREEKAPKSSFQLPPEIQAKIHFECLPYHPDQSYQANEYRVLDNRWTLKRSLYKKCEIGGWFIENGAIVAWEDSSNR